MPKTPTETMFGSNKPYKTIKKVKPHSRLKAPIKLKPKIDGISITMPIHEKEEQKQISSILSHLLTDKTLTQYYGYATKGGYRRSVLFYPVNEIYSAPPFLVQADPYDGSKAFMRFDWNPSRFSNAQLKDIKLQLYDLLNINWPVKLISLGRVTRLDIAVDLRGIHIDDLVIHNKWSRAMGLYTGADGRTETIYFGKQTSSQLCAYDLVKKAKEKGWPVPEVPMTRIERRYRKRAMVSELADLPNLLKNIVVHHPNPDTFPIGSGTFETFRNHCQMRGTKRALEAVPVLRRKQMVNWMQTQEANWWSPTSLWNSWPATLKKHGLLHSKKEEG